MKKSPDEYQNWLTVIRKWLKNNIAFSVMIGVIGFLLSTYKFYQEDYVNPRREFWEFMKETISDAKTKAVVISDLCEGFESATDKSSLIQEIKNLNIERREITDKVIDRKLNDKLYSTKSLSLIREFIQMNYKDYLYISFNGKCPKNILTSDKIEDMEKKIQESIDRDMGWY